MKKTKNGPAKADKNGDTQNGDDFTSMGETVTNKIPAQAFPSLPAGGFRCRGDSRVPSTIRLFLSGQ